MQENHYLVPSQLAGLEKNIEHNIHTDAVEDAEDWFVDAKERLLDVNNWKRYISVSNIDFHLTDIHSRMISRKAHKADHIRIDIPAQSTGFDWVVIEALEYDDYPDIDMETFAMRIRQVEDPANKQDGYLHNNATTTIVLERIGKTLSASYHGRNESENGNTDASWLGLSDSQWADIIKGFID